MWYRRDYSRETIRDFSLARSLVSQGWSRKKSRSRKNPIDTLRDPTLLPTHLGSQLPTQYYYDEFLDIISASFPELIPLIQLFYDNPGAVHYKLNIVKWATLFMEEGSTQGCPLSPILASLVVVRLLQPINNALRQRAVERLANGITHDDGRGGITNLLGFIDDISHLNCSTP